MSVRFRELDWSTTPLGELVLRRRWDPAVDREVYEVKLDDAFLMSSLFTVAEVEIANRALAHLAGPLDVAVGGLGLGYTARAVLENPNVRSLVVVDAFGKVIEWHERGLVPTGAHLTSDPRCRIIHGDFFGMLESASGFDPAAPGRLHDAIIVDIDHSPRNTLHPSHADLYEPAGLERLLQHLQPGGVFALWSNDPPDEEFTATLAETFAEARTEIVAFYNPLQQREATNTIYLATAA